MNKSVSPRQIELLLDFMEQHRSLALGRVRGKEGNALSKRLWQQLTEILNSDFNGAQKAADEWKKYFNQYKSRVKSKVRSIKQGVHGTGGGPANMLFLTPLEERLYSILGGCSSPLPVRHNPLDASTTNTNAPTAEDDSNIVGDSFATEIPAHSELNENITIEPGEFYFIPDVPNENEDMEMDRPPTNVDNADGEAEKTVRDDSTQKKNTVNPRKRRRVHTTPKVNNEFEEAGRQLAAMEQSRIEVEKAQVVAINRQAAAFENLAEQIKQLIELYAADLQQRQVETLKRSKKKIIRSSSDEE